jgi:hypothetical protein
METKDAVVGSAVLTADGQEIGLLQEISPIAFRVAAPEDVEFWIDNEYIEDATDQRVRLNFRLERLEEIKRETPERILPP